MAISKKKMHFEFRTVRVKQNLLKTLSATNSGFCSMKGIEVLLLSPGWDSRPSQGYLVSFAAVIGVVTHRSLPLTAAHSSSDFLSLCY